MIFTREQFRRERGLVVNITYQYCLNKVNWEGLRHIILKANSTQQFALIITELRPADSSVVHFRDVVSMPVISSYSAAMVNVISGG